MPNSTILVEEREGTFMIETGKRQLTLRASSEAERASWVRALLSAGAQAHPMTRYLAANPTPSPTARRAGSDGTAAATAGAAASTASTSGDGVTHSATMVRGAAQNASPDRCEKALRCRAWAGAGGAGVADGARAA
eukprot:6211324-Prymnesium_polylepis.1